MRLSIIVPVYNSGVYFEGCLKSIQNQSWKDYEVIIVDDGSNDGSERICDKYAELDERFKVLHKENGGLVSARKAALAVLTGDYVISVDSDDLLEEDYLERVVSELEADCPDMLACNYKVIDEDDRYIRTVANTCKNGMFTKEELLNCQRAFLYDSNLPGLNGGNLIYSIWTKAVKKDLYVSCQSIVDERIRWGEDATLVLLIMQKILSLKVCNVDGYLFRTNSTSMTNKPDSDEVNRLNVLVSFMIEHSDNSIIDNNQIYAYAVNVLFLLLYKYAEISASEYRDIAKTIRTLSIVNYAKKAKIHPENAKDRIKIYAIIHEKWYILKLLCQLNIFMRKKQYKRIQHN